MTEVVCVAPVENRLGEGPFWDAQAGRLYWFDIKAARLWSLRPDTGDVSDWALASRASAGAAVAGSDDLLISAEDGLWRFNPRDGRRAQAEIAVRLSNGYRSNDGKVDPAGALWWSTMDDNGGKRPAGVYRFDGRVSQRVFDGLHIVNSLAFSDDGRTGYVSDSSKRTIWRFAFDPRTCRAGEREIFAETPDGDPDGAAMDAEGGLWVALWGAGRIDRFDPDGQVRQSIALPVSQPSCCAFGGDGLETLYVTSAWDGLSDAARKHEPLAGALFSCRPGVRGQKVPPARAEP